MIDGIPPRTGAGLVVWACPMCAVVEVQVATRSDVAGPGGPEGDPVHIHAGEQVVLGPWFLTYAEIAQLLQLTADDLEQLE